MGSNAVFCYAISRKFEVKITQNIRSFSSYEIQTLYVHINSRNYQKKYRVEQKYRHFCVKFPELARSTIFLDQEVRPFWQISLFPYTISTHLQGFGPLTVLSTQRYVQFVCGTNDYIVMR